MLLAAGAGAMGVRLGMPVQDVDGPQPRPELGVGEAADGRQVLRGAEVLQPHILLLDVRKLEQGGLELLRRIRAKSPRTKVLILADFVEENFIARALQHGAHGCALKTAPPTELIKAIRTIHAGEFWASRKLMTQVVENLRARVDEFQGSLSNMREVLTDREHEIVIWAAQGMTNNASATQVGISAKTVKTHLHHAFRKLHIRRRGQLPRFPFSPHPFPEPPLGPPLS